MARYRIKAPVKNNGPHKFSGIVFVNGEAETDRPDQITYARAQGWELTRLPDPEPEPEPKSEAPPKPPSEGATGEQKPSDPEGDQQPVGDQQPEGDDESAAGKRAGTARSRR